MNNINKMFQKMRETLELMESNTKYLISLNKSLAIMEAQKNKYKASSTMFQEAYTQSTILLRNEIRKIETNSKELKNKLFELIQNDTNLK